MSDENVSGNTEDKGLGAGKPDNDYVKRSAYTEVSNDMHKYKSALKDANAKLAENEEATKAQEISKLEADKEYERLYKQAVEEKESLSTQVKTEREKFLNSHKVNALLQEIGGVQKKEYIDHANLKAIELDEDGTINEESLKKEAEKFRQNHFILLKEKKGTTLPNDAPKEINFNADLSKGDFNAHKDALKDVLKIR